MENIEINGNFERALDIANNTNDCLLLMGAAGSGKSTFSKHFTSHTKKNVVILAPTGVAAVNVGGQTIHSFFGFPPKPLTPNNINPNVQMVRDMIRRVDTFILDEISMVRADLLDGIDYYLRIVTNDDSPFGGKQIIMMGDLSQLPPVVKHEAEKQMFTTNWTSEFFFSANVFREISYHKVYFDKIYRQNNVNFINLLNKIKYNSISDEEIDQLNAICHKGLDIDYFNTTTLCTTNADAKAINQKQLEKINSPIVVLKAEVTGNFNTDTCPVDEEITIKLGCKIMIRTNDQAGRYFNGTTGTVTKIGEQLTVKLSDGDEILLSKKDYESVKYKYNSEKNSVNSESTGKMTQFPITLAYAVSIHKSQGITLDKVNLEFGRGAFSSGQVYVAISRCRKLSGVTFLRRLRREDIFVDKRISHFIDTFMQESYKQLKEYENDRKNSNNSVSAN